MKKKEVNFKDENSKDAVKDFESYVSVNLKMLRYMGLVIGVKDNKRDRRSRIVERLMTYVTNFVCIVDGIFQIQLIADVWAYDNDFVIQVMTNLLPNIVCISKGFRLAYCREDLQMLFERMAIIWENNYPRDKMLREKIFSRARQTLVFCKLYIYMMVAFVMCFGLPPIIYFVHYYLSLKAKNQTFDFSQRVFFIKYPFEINSWSIYLSILLQEEIILCFSGIYWICCDTLFAQFTTHTSLQFEILQHDINVMINSESNEDQLKMKITNFVKRHRQLLRLCESIEKVFSPILFATVLLTSINICANVFEMQKMIAVGRYGDSLLHIFQLVNVFFQLLVFCIYAERLTQQTSSIANAIYNCKWTEKNAKFRVYFQLLIIKSQKPFYCTAWGFLTIGHKRITSIVNRALSFYMMLQTVN